MKAIAHIRISGNNAMVSITSLSGDMICWASAGGCGFKGAQKSTFAAGLATAKRAAERAKELGVSEVRISLKGEGPNADGAIAGLKASGLAPSEA